VLFVANADEHLIHEPLIARPWPTPLKCIGKLPAGARFPVADIFVADQDALVEENPHEVPQAQADAVTGPDRMVDNFDQIAEFIIGLGFSPPVRQAATS
jgi:hypothetical protein